MITGHVAGFAITCKTYGWEGRILRLEDLFVEKEYRGKGVGTALITHLAKVYKPKVHCML